MTKELKHLKICGNTITEYYTLKERMEITYFAHQGSHIFHCRLSKMQISQS